jgi:AcrR family transcriptional regulator
VISADTGGPRCTLSTGEDAIMSAAPPRPSGRRPRGQVRSALIAAGLELARAGGPDAVVLREATRRVGVVPNAAYRHFADRDALLADVCVAAMGELARLMRERVAAAPEQGDPKQTAIARLAALGDAYLEFATQETGLFETAFAVPAHLEYAAGRAGNGLGPTPFQLLGTALDELVTAGVLPAERRPDAEYPIWSCLHGLAVLTTRGPLREMPEQFVRHVRDQVFGFITHRL